MYSYKVVVIFQTGCILALEVVFKKSGRIRGKWLYSDKICCTREKLVVFGQKGFIRAKVVVFGQMLYSRKCGCNQAN